LAKSFPLSLHTFAEQNFRAFPLFYLPKIGFKKVVQAINLLSAF
jgi:hypothetical protein